MKKRNGAAKSIIVLTAICLVISAVLAVVNDVTSPVIAQAAAERAEEARREVLPEAESFELISVEGIPASVTEVYKATNEVGYIFMLTAKGYGGDMNLICAIGNDGRIVACKTLSHSETAGLGSKTAGDEYRSQYIGQDSTLSGVSAVSGATISSTAYYNAVKDAFAAFELVTGQEGAA
jgi:electron transport complex protein RnfG